MVEQRSDRALRQPGIHPEGKIGPSQKFGDDTGQHRWQALAAEFAGKGNTPPTTIAELLIGLLESLGGGYAGVVVPRAAFHIANPVQRRQHMLAQLGCLGERRFEDLRRQVGIPWQIDVTSHLEYVIQQKQVILYWGLVRRHVNLLRDSEQA